MEPAHSPLLTDLYQLTMVDSYLQQGMHGPASFELFSRKLPPGRGFYIASGIEAVIDWLTAMRFSDAELAWIRDCGHFRADLADELADLHFTGHVEAVPDGTILFPQEPILRVTAPLPEAQLIESRVMNLIHLHSLLTSKAARAVLAAGDSSLVDFGMRRAHGAEAAMAAARSTWIAGYAGTSTCLAGAQYGIPTVGTMAHSYVLAFDREIDAFRAFATAHPKNVVLLIDTYDITDGARKVTQLAGEGYPVQGVRIDSGDLGKEAQRVREILDAAGLGQVRILVSGDLDEYAVSRLRADGAPIDGFGLGTRMDTAADQPHLDMAYKLQEYRGVARRKRSAGKVHWPGRKQVRRHFTNGVATGDTLCLAEEDRDGVPLLTEVIDRGQRTRTAESTDTIRQRVQQGLAALPADCRRLDADANAYPVEISAQLRACAQATDRQPH
ncbi:nicotinate phosphoribosyltransferase [Halorhodospira halophila]|uniref:Nicotinate phosphoribosyltransferase n=1 Tax=Halorhodospira halophila (strain DSM 244 / SL1) TaxID=349124 RepID=A1WXY2_HALHL|nr:nicotinate phosphoribosyltransferase [Halorhodospira halophila]ABM62544.1 putative nicotinate phosphoribosyltransferase [Halorhodospira halophila SL1]MBK1728222.1 nicotinate phosphoribosyltransferase [Halorhodospira halophila]